MNNFYAYIFSGITLLALDANAQLTTSWNQVYQHTGSSGYSNESRKVATDSNGNIFVLADVTSDIDPTGNVSASIQHYTVILKYTPAGVLDAYREIYVIDHVTNGFDHPGGFGLEIDNDNNVYVGYNIYNSLSNYNVAIAKHNNNLIRQWTYTFNPISLDEGIDIKVTPSGIVYALAKSASGSTTQYNLIKCDSTIASDSIPHFAFNANTEVLKSMVTDFNNDVFVTGYQLLNGYQSILSARVNSAGTLKWKRIYNGGSSNRNDVGSKILRGPNQELYIIGTSDRGAPFLNDGVVLKYYTGNGRFDWASFLDVNNGNESGISLDIINPTVLHACMVSNNKIITVRLETGRGLLTGRNTYEPVPLTPNSSIDSVSVIEFKTSPNNNVYVCGNVFAKDIQFKNFEASYLIKLNPVTGRFAIDDAFEIDAEISINGSSATSERITGMALEFNSNSLYTVTSMFSDYLSHFSEYVRLSAYTFPVPLKEISESAIDHKAILNIFPNPATNELSVFNSTGIANIKVYNTSGQLIIELHRQLTDKVTFKIDHIPLGVYFVKVTDETGYITTGKITRN